MFVQPFPQGQSRLRLQAMLVLGMAALLPLVSLLSPGSPGPLAPGLGRVSTQPLPLSFEPNRGQAGDSVRYVAHAPGGTLYFAPSEVALVLSGVKEPAGPAGIPGAGTRAPRPEHRAATPSLLQMHFLDSDPAVAVQSGATLPGTVSYLTGRDRAGWHTGLPTFESISYAGLYSGIDLGYSGTAAQLKGTYTVAPGADPSRIRWRYEGAQANIDAAGNLLITIQNSKLKTQNSIVEQAPVAWQEAGGVRVPVSSRYVLHPDGSVGFELGAYDRTRPLVIDPTIIYSTYLGGYYGDSAASIALDAAGNMYIAGSTTSTDFPIAGNPFQPVAGGQYDAFVSKLSPDGSTLIYSTFLGGAGEFDGGDFGDYVAVDATGNATVGGFTDANDFPTTPGAFQTAFGGTGDLFIAKLNATGSDLIFGSYWGGGAVEEPYGFATDAAGNTYFTGYFYPGIDSAAFVAALSPNGANEVVYRELGGIIPGPGDQNANSTGEGITIDAAGNIYVTGYTRAADFPTTPGAYRTSIFRFEDGFITKFSPMGQTMLYSTFIPGGGSDYPLDIAVDQDGNAFITGWTGSSDYPTTPGAFQVARGDPTASFVTKLNPAGSALVYSTYLGGPDFHFNTVDYGTAIRVSQEGNAYVTGYTSAPDFPVLNPIQATLHGPYDIFLTKFNPLGTGLEFSTYLGGSGGEAASSLAFDSQGTIYLAGGTSSTDFPLAQPYQATNHGSGDAFVMKIIEGSISPTPTLTGTPPTATPTACVPGLTSWRNEPTFTIARDYASAAVVDNKLYLIGGSNLNREPPYVEVVERFDPATQTWDTVAPIPVAATGMAAAALGSKIYVAGGFTVRNGFTIDKMQIYDATTNTWTQGRPLPQRTRDAAAAAYNGKIYIFGGGNQTSSNTVYEYDPATDTYATKNPLPTTESQIAAATVGDRIYVVGGYRYSEYAHYVYDPVADSWSTTATPLTPNFAWSGAFALNGELWVEGGFDNSTIRGYPPGQEVHIYNPATNTWRYGPAFNTPRTRSRAAAAIGGRGYVAGGALLENDDTLLFSLESIGYSACPTATATPSSTGVPGTTRTATPIRSATPLPGTPTSTSTACPVTFSDVHPADYFYQPVVYLFCRGVISGYADNTFRPFNDTTRGQLTKIVTLAEAWPIHSPDAPTFTDVPASHPFYQYVETAHNRGVISGYSDGTFRPASNVTRGQLSKIVVLAREWPIYNPPAPRFVDVAPSHPFYGYIETAYFRGIISGYGCGNACLEFRPGNNATRGQISKIVYNAVTQP
jgi:N-acetylneuraminic acid mutarotase